MIQRSKTKYCSKGPKNGKTVAACVAEKGIRLDSRDQENQVTQFSTANL